MVTNRAELQIFLNDKNHWHPIWFQDKKWMLKVYYLSIFAAVNDLNTSIQGRNQNIITLSEQLSAFKEKLQLWKIRPERRPTAVHLKLCGRSGRNSLLSPSVLLDYNGSPDTRFPGERPG